MLGPAFDSTLVRHARLPDFHDRLLCLPANKLIVNMVDHKNNCLLYVHHLGCQCRRFPAVFQQSA